MKMPFGKFKNMEINEIPENYLNWLYENVNLRPGLKEAVEGRLYGWTTSQVFFSSREELKSVYRRMALKWHPDRGGSNEAMQAINEFYNELKGLENAS